MNICTRRGDVVPCGRRLLPTVPGKDNLSLTWKFPRFCLAPVCKSLGTTKWLPLIITWTSFVSYFSWNLTCSPKVCVSGGRDQPKPCVYVCKQMHFSVCLHPERKDENMTTHYLEWLTGYVGDNLFVIFCMWLRNALVSISSSHLYNTKQHWITVYVGDNLFVRLDSPFFNVIREYFSLRMILFFFF